MSAPLDPVVADILAFLRQGPPGVGTFALSISSDGRVSSRQAGTFVDNDFSVTTVTRASAVRVKHLAHHPTLTYLWVDKAPSHPARNVSLEGPAVVLDDRASLEAFLKRREDVLGIPPPPEITLDRVLTVVKPRFLRAEGFLPEGRLVVMRDFASLKPEVRGFFA